MKQPTDAVAKFVREWCSVEDGESRAYKFLVKAGRSRSECHRAAPAVFIGDGADVPGLTEQVRHAIGTALALDKPAVFVEVYQGRGSKHPIRVLPVRQPGRTGRTSGLDEVRARLTQLEQRTTGDRAAELDIIRSDLAGIADRLQALVG